jgi:hypothetical protein
MHNFIVMKSGRRLSFERNITFVSQYGDPFIPCRLLLFEHAGRSCQVNNPGFHLQRN